MLLSTLDSSYTLVWVGLITLGSVALTSSQNICRLRLVYSTLLDLGGLSFRMGDISDSDRGYFDVAYFDL